jgi:hypothetical protein
MPERFYTQAVLKFLKLVRKRSIAKRLFMGEAYRLYRLRYEIPESDETYAAT